MSYVIVSSDGVKFPVSKQIAKMSVVIDSMMDESDYVADNEFPMPDVDSSTLQKVIEYCDHYLIDPMPEIAKPIQSDDFAKLVPKWYDEYASIDYKVLFKIVEAANYMDIPPLMNLICAKIASMIKDKSIEQIRETFSIENDLTPEEEAKLKEEYKWCEE